MNATSLEQLYSFGIFFLSGIITGILFDIFRVIRKSFKISDIHTYIEDIIFGIITGIFLIFMSFIYNKGNIRFYMFIALILGLCAYFYTISKYFIKINVKILCFFKYLISKIIYIIVLFIKLILSFFKKVLNKPFMFIIINFKKLILLINYKKKKKIE